jgi:tetratricopeptide (TPR) repeat protein
VISLARLLVAVAALTAASCATKSPVLPTLVPQTAEALELRDTPFFPQEEYQCGPAALATVLHVAGVSVAPSDLVNQVYLPRQQGSLQVELLAATRRADRIPYVIEPTLAALLAELDAGRPVLALQNLGLNALPVWHYAVVIGAVPAGDYLILRSGTERRKRTDVADFLRSWKMANNWGMVVLSPGEIPAITNPARLIAALARAEPTLSTPSRIQAYRAVLARWPGETTARFGYAHALHAAGELIAAEEHYRAIIDQHPRHAAALNNLAEVIADRGCYTQAAALARRALEIAGEDQPALVGPISETLQGLSAAKDQKQRCIQIEDESVDSQI